LGRPLFGVVFLFSILIFLAPATAQETNDENIGVLVVDMQRIQRDAAAAVNVREQSTAMRAELEAMVAERAKAISKEEAELAELRERLEPDEFRQRVREFEKKVFANRDFAQQGSTKLQAVRVQASNQLRRAIAPILAQLLRERRAQLMLDKSQVIDSALPTMRLAPLTPPE